MSAQLSNREKILSAVVGGTFFLLLNFFLIGYFLKNNASLRAEVAQQRKQLAVSQNLMTEVPQWAERDAWLKAHQPRMESQTTAGVKLLDHVTEMAKKHTLEVLQPAVGVFERHADYNAVPVSVEIKGKWKDLLGFMLEMQGPDKFIVFESSSLRVDTQDATQMDVKFKISKWFAP